MIIRTFPEETETHSELGQTTTGWEVAALHGIDKVAGGDAGVAYKAEPCCIVPNGGSAVSRTSPKNTSDVVLQRRRGGDRQDDEAKR
jgi:hypothetical protein